MSPSVLLPEYTSQLAEDGITHTIAKTAHSLRPTTVRTQSYLAELDASQLIYTRNVNPKAVPEPNSAEVWAQETYVPPRCHLNLAIADQLTVPHSQLHRPHDNLQLDLHGRLVCTPPRTLRSLLHHAYRLCTTLRYGVLRRHESLPRA